MSMSSVVADPYTPRHIAQTLVDYVDSDGILHIYEKTRSVLVRSQNDLSNLPSGMYLPGTIAYTAGFQAMWQLNASGSWVSMTS